MTRYLEIKPGSISETIKRLSDDYQAVFKAELEKTGKGIAQMTDAEKKAFFNKIGKMHNAKNEEAPAKKLDDTNSTMVVKPGAPAGQEKVIRIPKEKLADYKSKGYVEAESFVPEQAVNPYAVGMAAAMKATGDKPPLKKSTIVKAHDIAKKVKEEELTAGQKKLPPALQKAIEKKQKNEETELNEKLVLSTDLEKLKPGNYVTIKSKEYVIDKLLSADNKIKVSDINGNFKFFNINDIDKVRSSYSFAAEFKPEGGVELLEQTPLQTANNMMKTLAAKAGIKPATSNAGYQAIYDYKNGEGSFKGQGKKSYEQVKNWIYKNGYDVQIGFLKQIMGEEVEITETEGGSGGGIDALRAIKGKRLRLQGELERLNKDDPSYKEKAANLKKQIETQKEIMARKQREVYGSYDPSREDALDLNEITDEELEEANKVIGGGLISQAKAIAKKYANNYTKAYDEIEKLEKGLTQNAEVQKTLKQYNEEVDLEEACWTGYKQVGLKKKGDRMVPNCVPEEYVTESGDIVEFVELEEGQFKEIDIRKGDLKLAKDKRQSLKDKYNAIMANQAQGDENAIADQIRKLDMSIKKQEQELIDIMKKNKENQKNEAVDPERIDNLQKQLLNISYKLMNLDKSNPESKTKEAILKADAATKKLRLADLMKQRSDETNKDVKKENKMNYKSMKKSLKKEEETSKKTMTDKPLTKIEVNPKFEG